MTVLPKTPSVIIKRVIIYILMFLGAIIVLFPLFWMIYTALKPSGEELKLSLKFNKPLLKNFIVVWTNPDFPFWRYFLNSVVVATFGATFSTFFAGLGGYVFAKKNFFLKEILFWGLLSTIMVPGLMFFIPQFAIVTKLHWVNTYTGMVVPHLANVFGIFLVRQYMETIPDSIIESARIDGAGEFTIFRRLMVPLSISILTALFLTSFLFHWSNFLWHLVVNTPDSTKLTLPVGLATFQGQYAIEWAKLMAASCFSVVPIAILFVFAQRFFIEGLTAGAIKE